jgi:RimJ/RimL family protein N-acetyltransferase
MGSAAGPESTAGAPASRGLPLRTSSLVLRPFVVQDAEPIRRLNAEPSTRRWLPSHVYADAAAAESALAYLIACYREPGDPRRGPYVLAVERIEDGRLLGHVGFSPLDDAVEVSYAIAEEARGRGLGAEALACACAWAGRAFRLPGVVAATAAANAASRRTLERARFVHVRDEVVPFQGVRQAVSRYGWRATAAGA